MILTFADRFEMIATLGSGEVRSMVELGVYKGAFAEFCSKNVRPSKHVLVDFWDYDSYEFVLADAPQNVMRQAIFESYFDGKPHETLALAYQQVLESFAQVPNVQILKTDIAQAAPRFPDASFDIIYLDANHTYEFVLRDLHVWFPKLKAGGLFICNDFYKSAQAAKQNIGVIPAFQAFAKRFAVYPVALSMTEWSDLYFSNQESSELINRLREGLINTGQKVLEVPSEYLGSYHHRTIDLTVGQKYLLPSFRA